MPWNERSAMDQRTRFIADYLDDFFPFAELCLRYDISRPTGYKWVQRYIEGGAAGLMDIAQTLPLPTRHLLRTRGGDPRGAPQTSHLGRQETAHQGGPRARRSARNDSRDSKKASEILEIPLNPSPSADEPVLLLLAGRTSFPDPS